MKKSHLAIIGTIVIALCIVALLLNRRSDIPGATGDSRQEILRSAQNN